MIKLIGFRRMVFIAGLLALNLSVLGIYFFSISPLLDSVSSQRDAVRGQIEELRSKIGSIKQDMIFVSQNLPKYNELQAKGFFSSQDRFTISRMMEDLRVKAGIASFSFTIGDVAEISNADADAINYNLIHSRIKVEKIVSPLDANIYALAQQTSQSFPDYTRIQSLNLTRVGEVTEASLKDIADGKPVDFVNADYEFDWITMVPKPPEATAVPGGTPAGFRRQ